MGSTRQTVAVAMSGGVDSSLAAALMVEAGHRVIGLTMALTGDAEAITEEAATVARHLGLEHHRVELGEPFERLVLRPCWESYESGRTPNPCALCNRRLKFGALLEHARQLRAPRLATGHHARLRRRPTGAVTLARGVDATKDQSYFLSRLGPRQLAAALFPIGDRTKDQVRAEARARGLPSAENAESQDTCLALTAEGREGVFAETLRTRFRQPPPVGDIVDRAGHILGHHQGLHRFTLGQRRGLGVSLGQRAYVLSIDGPQRRVVLTTDARDLQATSLRAVGARWHREPPPIGAPLSCQVQVRSRHDAVDAEARRLDERAFFVELHQSIAAVTPGQVAALYDGDEVIGSGWIETITASPR